MGQLARTSDGCPSRHSKPVSGTCGICKKTVCPDCKSPITSETSGKIICKFCYEDLNNIQKKINESFEVKIEEKIGLIEKISTYLFGAKEKVCDTYNHVGGEILGVCIACRKNVCEKCVMPDKKLSTGGLICRRCCAELYDVQGEISRENKARFIGGLREFFKNLGRTSRLILTLLLVVVVLTFICSVAVFWVFYQMCPASFESVVANWRFGNYKYMITQDMPSLAYELKERMLFGWKHWGDPHADYDEDLRKKAVEEYKSIFAAEPEENKPLRDINDAISEYKKQLQEQEAARNK